MHWACKEGRANIVDMLIGRGAKINATNMGDDTALHLASAHGHREIVQKVNRYLSQWKLSHDSVNHWVFVGVGAARETMQSCKIKGCPVALLPEVT